MKIIPVILCGGSGTRLWPLSRKQFPKQFLKLMGKLTLFQQSISRAINIEDKNIEIEEILIVTNENHRFLVLEQVDDLKLNVPIRVLLEPEPKNTAPALTLAALAAYEKNPESILVVLPADQYVKDLNQFTIAVHNSIGEANDKTIVTLGITPTRPDIGFGYICYQGEGSIKDVLGFKEKPNLEAAKKLISNENSAWNGGIFILKAITWLNIIEKSNNLISKSVENAWKNKNNDQWFIRPDKDMFMESPSDSIDYAVMEKIKALGVTVKMLLLDAGWSDLGSFNSLDDVESKDKHGNIFKGDVISMNTKNTIAISSNKNISLLGIQNLIVVDSGDSVLVASKSDLHLMKELVKKLENHHHLLIHHNLVNRPWGFFETIKENSTYKVKLLEIKPGRSISLQRHKKRSEHWVVVKGVANIIKGEREILLNQNQSIYIEKNEIHRVKNASKDLLQIIEVQSGEYLGEDDIERLEDNYGR